MRLSLGVFLYVSLCVNFGAYLIYSAQVPAAEPGG
eukprot:COSAG05_NODE_10617_length_555_cov_1.609649_1_plen_34_part_01